MSPFHRLAAPAALVLAVVAAPALRAQSAASDSVAPAAVVAPMPAASAPGAAPSVVQATPVAATRAMAVDVAPEVALRATRAREAGRVVMQQGSGGNGKMYMIIGGVAFLAGAIIGDDAGTIIMIGGAGIGLYGLYLYLQ